MLIIRQPIRAEKVTSRSKVGKGVLACSPSLAAKNWTLFSKKVRNAGQVRHAISALRQRPVGRQVSRPVYAFPLSSNARKTHIRPLRSLKHTLDLLRKGKGSGSVARLLASDWSKSSLPTGSCPCQMHCPNLPPATHPRSKLQKTF